MSTRFIKSGIVLARLLAAGGLQAAVWTGGGDNLSWSDPDNWEPAGVPGDGAAVTNAAGAILLSNATAELASFTMTGGSVTFSNWTTRLRAMNVDLQGGTLTLPPAFANNQMSNRVWIVGENLSLGANAKIDVAARGYAVAHGPGTPVNKCGAAHGGRGGRGDTPAAPTQPYGSREYPLAPGSGGTYDAGYASYGDGGGAVMIQATGKVTLDGMILADGEAGYRNCSGGSGGSVLIECATFAGTSSGLVSANGGINTPYHGDGKCYSGGGGGGRIAVHYSALEGAPRVRFRAAAGTGTADQGYMGLRHRAGRGTLYLPDARLLSPVIADEQFMHVDVAFPEKTWTVPSLIVSNASLTFSDPGFKLTVTNDCRIDAGGRLGLSGELVTLGGSLVLTNGGTLHVVSGPTGGNIQAFGGRVSVTGDLMVAAGSWIIPWADETDGGTVLIEAENVRIVADGGINADGGGYKSYTGPGKPSGTAFGAGYGGRGGNILSGGASYGTPAAGNQPGSGGGESLQGGHGGGCVRIAASGSVTVDGLITANGLRTWSSGGAGGSGGGIDIRCAVLDGSATGLMACRGGGGVLWGTGIWYGYPGGGGRIALGYGALAPGFAVRLDTGFDPGADMNTPITAQRPVRPEMGTVWASDASLLSDNLEGERFKDVNLFIDGMASYVADHLSVGDSRFHFGPAAFTLTVANDLQIGDGGHLGVRGDIRVQHGNLTVGDGGALSVYSAATNGLGRAYGSLVAVGGTLSVGSDAWVYPHSHPTDGGSVLFQADNVMVAVDGGFDADAYGFQWATGPGKALQTRGGGGHGGRGGTVGTSGTGGGSVYGNVIAPALPGSGGGGPAGSTGFGGGVIWIEAAELLRADGLLLARGMPSATTGGGAGSGGSIWLAARRLEAGSQALLSVVGGQAIKHSSSLDPDKWYTAGGGGGRIALWLRVSEAVRGSLLAGQTARGAVIRDTPFPRFDATLSVAGGEGYQDGEPGTVRFVDGRPRGTAVMLR